MKRQRSADPKLPKLLQRIAHNLEKLRNSRGWTQAEITEKLDTDLRWYQRLESGKHTFSLETLSRLSTILKVDIIELFEK